MGPWHKLDWSYIIHFTVVKNKQFLLMRIIDVLSKVFQMIFSSNIYIYITFLHICYFLIEIFILYCSHIGFILYYICFCGPALYAFFQATSICNWHFILIKYCFRQFLKVNWFRKINSIFPLPKRLYRFVTAITSSEVMPCFFSAFLGRSVKIQKTIY